MNGVKSKRRYFSTAGFVLTELLDGSLGATRLGDCRYGQENAQPDSATADTDRRTSRVSKSLFGRLCGTGVPDGPMHSKGRESGVPKCRRTGRRETSFKDVVTTQDVCEPLVEGTSRRCRSGTWSGL